MKLMVLFNLDKPNALSCTAQVCDYLHSVGAQILMKDGSEAQFYRAYINYQPFYGQIEKADVILVIGGDGTIIHTAKHALQYDKPLIGVNAGRLGFLAGVEQDGITSLARILKGEYQIDYRMVLEITHSSSAGETHYLALNDVVISKGAVARMVDLEVYSGNRQVGSYRADGLIFSTPTGSTAYALSAGGPIIDPALHSIALTPISPHSLFDRTIVFSSDTELTVRPVGERADETYLTVDGEKTVHVDENDTILVRKSDKQLKMLQLSDKPFYEVLDEKFIKRLKD